METIRTFIALELPEGLKETLAGIQKRLTLSTEGIRWVKPENIHLTLKFLGSVNKEKAGDIGRILKHTAKGFSPFVINIIRLGAFPNPRNPKVLWVEIKKNRNLWSFYEKLEGSLLEVGIPKEKRSFSPHLTLGRVKDARKKKDLRVLLEDSANCSQGSFEASRVVFFRSDLHPMGPVYSILEEVKLTAGF